MIYGLLALFATLEGAHGSDSSPYVPHNVSCPSDASFVRTANELSPNETSWLEKRRDVIKPILIDWLKSSNMTDFDPESFYSGSTDVPVVGIAFSGGGYRAMLSGAGQLAGLDNRTGGSTSEGGMGGLLQGSTYLAGLSGGNWLVGSVVVNNFTSVQSLQQSDDLWDLTHSLLEPGGVDIFSTFGYWDTIIDDVEDKKSAGFNTSLTDMWGRGLGYQLFNSSKGGQGLAYSSIRNYPVFTEAQMPFPIHVADRRNIGEQIVSLNSSVFEFNPFELGSWDPNLYAFTDLKYLGSEVNNGKPNTSECVNGFDNAGFMVGTSATLFNQFLLQLNTTGLDGEILKLARSILTDIGNDNDDIAIYDPNPFGGYTVSSNSNNEVLTLVDGGEDDENIPLHPLIQPQRNVSAILAFDNSADTTMNWPNGSSLIASYERQFGDQSNGTIFPYVPDANTFINSGLTGQPVFFGCSSQNLTSLFSGKNESSSNGDSGRFIPPVIIYIANSEHSYASNTSTFKLSYDTEELGGMIENGYNIVTQNNGTLDSEWRTCVACALILRDQQGRNETPTEQCQRCFTKYCWDGKTQESGSNVAHRRDNQSNIVHNGSAVSSGFVSVAPSVSSALSASAASASASAASSSKSGGKKNSASLNVAPSTFAVLLMAAAAALQ